MKEGDGSVSAHLESITFFTLHVIFSVSFFKKLSSCPCNVYDKILTSSSVHNELEKLTSNNNSTRKNKYHEICPSIPHPLSEHLINEFISRGIVVVPQVLNKDEVQLIRTEYHNRLGKSGVNDLKSTSGIYLFLFENYYI